MEELPGCAKPFAYIFFTVSAILLLVGLCIVVSGKGERDVKQKSKAKEEIKIPYSYINQRNSTYIYYEDKRAPTPDDAYDDGYEEGYRDGYFAGENCMNYYENYDDDSEYYNYYEQRYQEGYEEGYRQGYYNGESDCE